MEVTGDKTVGDDVPIGWNVRGGSNGLPESGGGGDDTWTAFLIDGLTIAEIVASVARFFCRWSSVLIELVLSTSGLGADSSMRSGVFPHPAARASSKQPDAITALYLIPPHNGSNVGDFQGRCCSVSNTLTIGNTVLSNNRAILVTCCR